ncbi:MAG: GTPase Era [Oscillospiraceae bacterium]|jgi:GTP-binding protein Era|nr:GTPase Era [Oscillospiraceae bacterium]
MIAIIGRANVGKSTLTNRLTGDKVAIVSPKPQTTRNRIFGVFSHGDIQMILLDTPGFHKSKTRLGDYMVGVIKESVADVDTAALIVEPVDNIGTQEEMLIEHIKKTDVPAVLVINKIDTIKPELTLPIIERYSQHHNFDAIIPISAKTGAGISELLEVFQSYAKPGPQLFPDGMTTDQPEIQIVAEIIREKLLICLDKEIPHGTAVEITKFSERGDEESVIIDVDATIYCDKSSHKGMIIGKNGAMLKKIGQYAREDFEKFMGAKVFLQTWIKVKENWRDSKTMIKNFGYKK